MKQHATVDQTEPVTADVSPPPTCRHCGISEAGHFSPVAGVRNCPPPWGNGTRSFTPGPTYDQLREALEVAELKLRGGPYPRCYECGGEQRPRRVRNDGAPTLVCEKCGEESVGARSDIGQVAECALAERDDLLVLLRQTRVWVKRGIEFTEPSPQLLLTRIDAVLGGTDPGKPAVQP